MSTLSDDVITGNASAIERALNIGQRIVFNTAAGFTEGVSGLVSAGEYALGSVFDEDLKQGKFGSWIRSQTSERFDRVRDMHTAALDPGYFERVREDEGKAISDTGLIEGVPRAAGNIVSFGGAMLKTIGLLRKAYQKTGFTRGEGAFTVLGTGLTAALTESAIEASQAYDSAIKEGSSAQEAGARAALVFSGNEEIAAATGTIEATALFLNKFTHPKIRHIAAGLTAVVFGTTQGLQEVAQNTVQRKAERLQGTKFTDFIEDIKEPENQALAINTFLGGLIGGAALSKIAQPNTKNITDFIPSPTDTPNPDLVADTIYRTTINKNPGITPIEVFTGLGSDMTKIAEKISKNKQKEGELLLPTVGEIEAAFREDAAIGSEIRQRSAEIIKNTPIVFDREDESGVSLKPGEQSPVSLRDLNLLEVDSVLNRKGEPIRRNIGDHEGVYDRHGNIRIKDASSLKRVLGGETVSVIEQKARDRAVRSVKKMLSPSLETVDTAFAREVVETGAYGLYRGGAVRLNPERTLDTTIPHELAHAFLDKQVSRDERRTLFDEIRKQHKKRYEKELARTPDSDTAAEEVFAELAAEETVHTGLLGRIIRRFRSLVRSLRSPEFQKIYNRFRGVETAAKNRREDAYRDFKGESDSFYRDNLTSAPAEALAGMGNITERRALERVRNAKEATTQIGVAERPDLYQRGETMLTMLSKIKKPFIARSTIENFARSQGKFSRSLAVSALKKIDGTLISVDAFREAYLDEIPETFVVRARQRASDLYDRAGITGENASVNLLEIESPTARRTSHIFGEKHYSPSVRTRDIAGWWNSAQVDGKYVIAEVQSDFAPEITAEALEDLPRDEKDFANFVKKNYLTLVLTEAAADARRDGHTHIYLPDGDAVPALQGFGRDENPAVTKQYRQRGSITDTARDLFGSPESVTVGGLPFRKFRVPADDRVLYQRGDGIAGHTLETRLGYATKFTELLRRSGIGERVSRQGLEELARNKGVKEFERMKIGEALDDLGEYFTAEEFARKYTEKMPIFGRFDTDRYAQFGLSNAVKDSERLTATTTVVDISQTTQNRIDMSDTGLGIKRGTLHFEAGDAEDVLGWWRHASGEGHYRILEMQSDFVKNLPKDLREKHLYSLNADTIADAATALSGEPFPKGSREITKQITLSNGDVWTVVADKWHSTEPPKLRLHTSPEKTSRESIDLWSTGKHKGRVQYWRGEASVGLFYLNKPGPTGLMLFLQNNYADIILKKAAIDASAKGYGRILLPTGETAAKVEGFGRSYEGGVDTFAPGTYSFGELVESYSEYDGIYHGYVVGRTDIDGDGNISYFVVPDSVISESGVERIRDMADGFTVSREHLDNIVARVTGIDLDTISADDTYIDFLTRPAVDTPDFTIEDLSDTQQSVVRQYEPKGVFYNTAKDLFGAPERVSVDGSSWNAFQLKENAGRILYQRPVTPTPESIRAAESAVRSASQNGRVDAPEAIVGMLAPMLRAEVSEENGYVRVYISLGGEIGRDTTGLFAGYIRRDGERITDADLTAYTDTAGYPAVGSVRADADSPVIRKKFQDTVARYLQDRGITEIDLSALDPDKRRLLRDMDLTAAHPRITERTLYQKDEYKDEYDPFVPGDEDIAGEIRAREAFKKRPPSSFDRPMSLSVIPLTAANIRSGANLFRLRTPSLDNTTVHFTQLEDRSLGDRNDIFTATDERGNEIIKGTRKQIINFFMRPDNARIYSHAAQFASLDYNEVYNPKIPSTTASLYTEYHITPDLYASPKGRKRLLYFGEMIKTRAVRAGKLTGEFLRKFILPSSETLRGINPLILAKIRRHFFAVEQDIHEATKVVEAFAAKHKELDERDAFTLKYTLAIGDEGGTLSIITKNGMLDEYNAVRKLLDERYSQLREMGIDVGYLSRYFPRKVKRAEQDSFMEEMYGKFGRGTISRVISQENKKRERNGMPPLTKEEKITLINRRLLQPQITFSGRKSHIKEREIPASAFETRFVKYYEDPITAISGYIADTTSLIETARFFGKNASLTNLRDSLDLDSSVGKYVLEEWMEGRISEQVQETLTEELVTLFRPTISGPWVSNVKSAMYIDTLGSPLNAITQLGDLAFAVYANGLLNTARGAKAALSNTKLARKFFGEDPRFVDFEKDLGMGDLLQEFREERGSLSEVFDKLTRVIGFRQIDLFGKNTVLSGAFIKYQNLARKGQAEKIRNFKYLFKNKKDRERVAGELSRGELSYDVKYLLLDTLADFQPILQTEVPLKYRSTSYGRLFYTLKTFTLKQLGTIHREMISDITSGEKERVQRGLGNLTRYLFWFTLLGVAVDEFKDILKGEFGRVEREELHDAVLRSVGASRYLTYRARTEGIGSAITSQLRPPTKIIDSVYKDMVSETGGQRWTRSVPVGGALYYEWMSPQTKRDRKDLQKYAKDVLDMDIDLDTLLPKTEIPTLDF